MPFKMKRGQTTKNLTVISQPCWTRQFPRCFFGRRCSFYVRRAALSRVRETYPHRKTTYNPPSLLIFFPPSLLSSLSLSFSLIFPLNPFHPSKSSSFHLVYLATFFSSSTSFAHTTGPNQSTITHENFHFKIFQETLREIFLPFHS